MAGFDYTSRDYLSIKQDLLNRASTALPEWSSRSTSDFGMVMVDLWAYMGDILHYYVDRAAAETYVGTAVNRESIVALANLFDYRPANATSSTGFVTVYASNPTHSASISIPEGTGFVAPATDNLPIVYFTSTASASMGPSVSAITVPVAEGRLVTNEAPTQSVTGNTYSNGTAGQRFNLRNKDAMVSSIVVTVAEGTSVGGSPTTVSYFYTPDLSTAPSDSRLFSVEIASDGMVQVLFGNGINGKVPSNRAEIRVSYRRGQGAGGNITAGRVTAFDTTAIADAYVGESSDMTGGSDAETLESMKTNIPLMFRTQDRAVSLQDFKDLALRVPQIVKATCAYTSTAIGASVTVYGVPYQSDYLGTASTSITVPTTVQESVVEYFEPRIMVGASVGAANSIPLIGVNVSATVYVKDGYVANWVATAASDEIDKFFEFDNVVFNQTLSVGQLYRAIQNLEGVDYVVITTFQKNGVTNTSLSPITSGETTLFKKGTVTIGTSGGITGTFS